MVHAARGRVSNRKLSAKAEKQAVAILSQPVYAGFGPTLAAEYLEQRHGVQVGREMLRRWMAAAGLWKPRRRKSGRPHPWRPRRSCRGELVQWDTSEHDWLEGRGEKLYLIGMIDDASSELLARFVRHDSGEENRRLLKTYLEQNGRPVAFYNRASLFVTAQKQRRRAQALALSTRKTAPARSSPNLLPPIAASTMRSRSWTGNRSRPIRRRPKAASSAALITAQDRLVKGLRVAGATTIEQANAYLESEFLPWWNATLRVQPAHPDEAHRELGPEHDLDSALSQVETRRVANDYTIRFRGKSYQIDRKAIVPGLRNSRVRVERRLDGVLACALRQARTGAEALRRAAPIGAPAAQERPGGTRCGSGREG